MESVPQILDSDLVGQLRSVTLVPDTVPTNSDRLGYGLTERSGWGYGALPNL